MEGTGVSSTLPERNHMSRWQFVDAAVCWIFPDFKALAISLRSSVKFNINEKKKGGGQWSSERPGLFCVYLKSIWCFLSQIFVTDTGTIVLKGCVVCCVSSPTYGSRLFRNSSVSLDYVRCKACLVQSHKRKLLISAWKPLYTSAARNLALVLGVINPLQQSLSDMCILLHHALHTPAYFCRMVHAL